MPNARFTVTFDSEKLSAIKQFATTDTPTIEEQLQEQLDKIYIKIVPAPVRQYIEGKAIPQAKSKNVIKTEEKTLRGDSD